MKQFLAMITPLAEGEYPGNNPGAPGASRPIAITGPIIKAGESLSNGLDLTQGDLLKIIMPVGWTPASLSFQLSPDGNQYHDLFYLTGFEVTMPTVVPDTVVIISYDVGRAISWIKLRSGTRDNPISQKEDRVFSVVISTYTGK
jgi:hypothetical protein